MPDGAEPLRRGERSMGRVYRWEPDPTAFVGGALSLSVEPLPYLDPARPNRRRLSGRFVDVRNGTRVMERRGAGGLLFARSVGEAAPNRNGDFLFAPAAGGSRNAKTTPRVTIDPTACAEASWFGQVNAYAHMTRIAEHIDRLLAELGARPLPKARVIVNAHERVDAPSVGQPPAVDETGAYREAVRENVYVSGARAWADDDPRGDLWDDPWRVKTFGEIRLTPGVRGATGGLLPQLAGARYQCSASHIAPHLYRQYGFHVARWTADFMANAFALPSRERRDLSVTSSGICDYWAATMLGTPHIFCWHYRHEPGTLHSRSLATPAGEAVTDPDAGPSKLGTALAAALWSLREALIRDDDQSCDALVLAALLEVGRLVDDPENPDPAACRALRDGFDAFAAALLHADAVRFGGRYAARIREAMGRHGVTASEKVLAALAEGPSPKRAPRVIDPAALGGCLEKIRTRAPDAIVPADQDLLQAKALEARLRDRGDPPYDLVVVGDVMTGLRMRHRIRRYGPGYVFAAVKPLFERAAVAVGNLEGPLAERAEHEKTTRGFSYQVDPQSAEVLRLAPFHVLSIANNHIIDCGRDGVRETLATLESQGIAAIGGGLEERYAHDPTVLLTRNGRLGLLGYCANARTAARPGLPGSAWDLPERVERDIGALKPHVERIAVLVHWGAPYERTPQEADRERARRFIDCGADLVIGHHPHVIQPFEIHRGRPIFYSIGNFAYGSGNSRAESLLVGVRFGPQETQLDVYPVYVKNRDPRLDYQPKVLCGEAGRATLDRLRTLSGAQGEALEISDDCARLRLSVGEGKPRPASRDRTAPTKAAKPRKSKRRTEARDRSA